LAVVVALAAPAHSHTVARQCDGAASFRQFSATIWAPSKWRRGSPAPAVRAAERRRLARARGCGYRGKLKARWERDKRAYFQHRRYKLRWGDCGDTGPVPDCIHGAALTYDADEGWMLRVSMCESRWDRFAYNPSGSTGLFQFMRSTWASTPYGGHSIYSVRWQSLAAAWMWSVGRQNEWVCQG
jgi:hypothetical protein